MQHSNGNNRENGIQISPEHMLELYKQLGVLIPDMPALVTIISALNQTIPAGVTLDRFHLNGHKNPRFKDGMPLLTPRNLALSIRMVWLGREETMSYAKRRFTSETYRILEEFAYCLQRLSERHELIMTSELHRPPQASVKLPFNSP